MSTSSEITRLQNARNTIRDKLIDLGLATSTTKLDGLATAIDGIVNNGAVSAEIQEGATYQIPAGYHDGSGTVSGVAGGGNYALQDKVVTPTKAQQAITPDAGKYGLSSVTVKAIPDAYQNISGVTATAPDVLANKTIVTATGESVAGTMPNNGAVSKTLTPASTSYTVPAGYHDGTGSVSIVTETKTATPTESSQTITPTSGKVLSSVTVNAIPSNYGSVDNADAVAGDILTGKVVVTQNADGEAVEVTGTMADNGTVTKTLDATANNQSATIAAGKHSGSGKVSIVLEEKSATPGTSAQTITPTAGKVLSKVTVAATPTETKTVTPTTSAQDVTPASGKFLSKVTVNAIPTKFGDTTEADAVAGDILAGKIAITNIDGVATQVTGMMADNGTVTTTLDATTNNQSITIAAGKHSGSGNVNIVLETKSATPTTSTQNITPTAGKVLSKVTVNPIPNNYGNVSDATGVASDVLSGKIVYAKNSTTGAAMKLTGSMTNNGAISASIDGLTTTSYSVPAGYTSGGTVALTNAIEEALAAI